MSDTFDDLRGQLERARWNGVVSYEAARLIMEDLFTEIERLRDALTRAECDR